MPRCRACAAKSKNSARLRDSVMLQKVGPNGSADESLGRQLALPVPVHVLVEDVRLLCAEDVELSSEEVHERLCDIASYVRAHQYAVEGAGQVELSDGRVWFVCTGVERREAVGIGAATSSLTSVSSGACKFSSKCASYKIIHARANSTTICRSCAKLQTTQEDAENRYTHMEPVQLVQVCKSKTLESQILRRKNLQLEHKVQVLRSKLEEALTTRDSVHTDVCSEDKRIYESILQGASTDEECLNMLERMMMQKVEVSASQFCVSI